jgi:hypothetical protein
MGTHPAGSTVLSTANFNHDATNDVLWFNPSNLDLDLWKISNAQWAGSVDIGSHPAGYTPIAHGDYNNDGTPDVLWYNPTSGDVDIWKIQNGQWAGSSSVGPHPLGAQPLGPGDFNSDGTSDVLWYNPSTNDVEVWMMQNAHWSASVDIGTHPAGWQPIGDADFDRDGTSDVVWYNPTTRDVEFWKIVNGHWAGSTDIGTHPAGYVPAGIADMNGDGSPDIVWFNGTTGDVDIGSPQTATGRPASTSARTPPAGHLLESGTLTATAISTCSGASRRPTTSRRGCCQTLRRNASLSALGGGLTYALANGLPASYVSGADGCESGFAAFGHPATAKTPVPLRNGHCGPPEVSSAVASRRYRRNDPSPLRTSREGGFPASPNPLAKRNRGRASKVLPFSPG